MSTRRVLVAVFVGLFITLRAAWAQESDDAARLAQVEAQLLSSWWVKVEGEAGQRIMRITRIGLRGDGNFGLDLNYGILGGGQGPLKGTLVRLGPAPALKPNEWVGAKTYKLEFTTGAGTVISTESAESGVFAGTFTTRSGSAKPIRLERVSDEEIQARTNTANAGKRAAAEKWLAKDEIKISYEGSYKSTFTVDMKAKTVTFYGSDDFCARGAVPASARVDDRDMLVFTFNPKRPGCPELQYSFDPLSKSGSIRQRPGDAAPETPWGGPSGSKIALVE